MGTQPPARRLRQEAGSPSHREEAHERRRRVTEAELLSAARQASARIEEAQAIIRESEGTYSVVSPSQHGDGSAVEMLADPR